MWEDLQIVWFVFVRSFQYNDIPKVWLFNVVPVCSVCDSPYIVVSWENKDWLPVFEWGFITGTEQSASLTSHARVTPGKGVNDSHFTDEMGLGEQ